MSYEIYYDRAFIRVNDLFIPLVNQGSNNCWEYNCFSKRDVPEKNWQVLNWQDRARLLYTEAEVRKIAMDYEKISQESGTCFKSRHRSFESGEFERWILCGLKSALTIEEYVVAGNILEIYDFSADEIKDWKSYPFSTTEEFLTLIDTLKEHPRLNIHFGNNRKVYRSAKKPKDKEIPEEYYVLNARQKMATDIFFCNLTHRGYRYTWNHLDNSVRVFGTGKKASSYLEKYKNRLQGFEVKKIQNMKLVSL